MNAYIIEEVDEWINGRKMNEWVDKWANEMEVNEWVNLTFN